MWEFDYAFPVKLLVLILISWILNNNARLASLVHIILKFDLVNPMFFPSSPCIILKTYRHLLSQTISLNLLQTFNVQLAPIMKMKISKWKTSTMLNAIGMPFSTSRCTLILLSDLVLNILQPHEQLVFSNAKCSCARIRYMGL